MTARGLLAGAILVALGCSSAQEEHARGRDEPSRPAMTVSGKPLARPARVPRLDFEAEGKCFVYWREVATGVASIRREVRCPREVVAGEAMRLAGRSCFRESPDALRRGPIRCAYQLLKIEQALLTGEGEWDLAPHPED